MGHPTFSFSPLRPKLHPAVRGGGDSLHRVASPGRASPGVLQEFGAVPCLAHQPGAGVQGAPSPRFDPKSPGAPGLVAGPGQAPFASTQHLLCTDPEKLSVSPLAFMAPDLGALLPEPHSSLYMMQRLFPCIFPPCTSQSSPNSYEAGTDVQPAPLPLPRGRCPHAPSRAPRLCSPGELGRVLGTKARAPRSLHPIPSMPGTLWSP